MVSLRSFFNKQLVFRKTWSWDVRTKKLTWKEVSTGKEFKGLAVYGPLATLFTVGPGNMVQQYDLSHPAKLVQRMEHLYDQLALVNTDPTTADNLGISSWDGTGTIMTKNRATTNFADSDSQGVARDPSIIHLNFPGRLDDPDDVEDASWAGDYLYQAPHPLNDGGQASIAPPTDSGYASTGNAQNTGEPTDDDDRRTVMTDGEDLNLPYDEKSALISSFAQGLYCDAGPLINDAETAATISKLLPAWLKDFSAGMMKGAAEKEHKQAVSFVRQNRQ
jgi:hypothetical protein